MTDELLLAKIAQIIDTRVGGQIALQLEPIKQQLSVQSTDVQLLRTVQQKQNEELKKIKKKLNKTAKDVGVMINQFDRRISTNAKAIDHIKSHLHLSS
ncbi:MAG: hypothetical protein H0W89_04495 [Candidatus Levybacteria bacterium]|nr:hypothetical protein [Candidatus Levybacteria bacterium]